jgi:hypothetical protein
VKSETGAGNQIQTQIYGKAMRCDEGNFDGAMMRTTEPSDGFEPPDGVERLAKYRHPTASSPAGGFFFDTKLT